LKKIEIVYVLNRFQTAIREIVAQARDGGMQIWRWTLGTSAEGAEVIPFVLPPTPPLGGRSVADEVVYPKPIQKPDEASESD
jgi:hypothetical protein